MTVHILAVCGRLMSGVAHLAAKKGFEVVGYDDCFDPPVSTLLEKDELRLVKGYPSKLPLKKGDHVIVGNRLRRNGELIQWLIEKRVKLYSAPEWLMEFVLRDRKVIAVTGSHGKTTTTTMIAWVLQQAGYQPGYLIGGTSEQLGGSASLGKGPYFVIEADEYDSAFFDKRPKFVHYWPVILVISHIEYDHADIYPNIESIVTQFGYLLRLLPQHGYVVFNNITPSLLDMIEAFKLEHVQYGKNQNMDLIEGTNLRMIGDFNRENALAAYLVTKRIGISDEEIKTALSSCIGPERRQKLMFAAANITAYDDFAHHPSELAKIVNTLGRNGDVIAVYHPATYTQREGLMDERVVSILKPLKLAIVLLPKKHNLNMDLYRKAGILLCQTEADCIQPIMDCVRPDDQVVAMSAYYLGDFWKVLVSELNEKYNKIAV